MRCLCVLCVPVTLRLAAPTLSIDDSANWVLLCMVEAVDAPNEGCTWYDALGSRAAGEALLETAPDDAV